MACLLNNLGIVSRENAGDHREWGSRCIDEDQPFAYLLQKAGGMSPFFFFLSFLSPAPQLFPLFHISSTPFFHSVLIHHRFLDTPPQPAAAAILLSSCLLLTMTLLAVELKEGTKILHAEAGRSKFMKYFFKGEVSLALYGRFLVSLYQVYNALEQALDEHKENAQLALLYFPRELSRKAALEQDLEFFNGPQWREMILTITPAQQAYIDAIRRCASSPTPELLAAHAYVRYLGDLSGGQVLAKRLQKFNDLPEDQGVAFYLFPLIEDHDQFKEMFRKRLNQIEVDDTLREQIVQEAKDTFLRNIDIFCEFDHELQGLPMSRKEQIENLEVLEREKAALRQELQTNVKDTKQEEITAMQSGFLGNLWSSLSTAVGLKSTTA